MSTKALVRHRGRMKHLFNTVALFGLPIPTGVALANEPVDAVDVATEEADAKAAQRRLRAERRAERGYSWAVLPGAFYQQETSVGFAAFGSLTFDMKDPHPDTWASNVTATAVYTLQNQASFSVWSQLYFGEANLWGVESAMFLEHFPTNYYGVGPESHPDHQVFTRRQARSDIAVRRRVSDAIFIGVAHHAAGLGVRNVLSPVTADGDPSTAPDAWLDSGDVPGGDGGRVHGLGALLRWDSRDNNQSARSGLLVDGELAHHPRVLGSTAGFGYGRLDVRGFVPVYGATLAVQGLTQAGWGEMPFTSMFELGGDRMLRGMYQGRFRDRSAATLQTELRVPVIWRFSAVAFVGAGHVASSWIELARHAPRWSAGGGLRFELDPEDRSTIRLDVGSGPDGTGFIVTFGEAF